LLKGTSAQYRLFSAIKIWWKGGTWVKQETAFGGSLGSCYVSVRVG